MVECCLADILMLLCSCRNREQTRQTLTRILHQKSRHWHQLTVPSLRQSTRKSLPAFPLLMMTLVNSSRRRQCCLRRTLGRLLILSIRRKTASRRETASQRETARWHKTASQLQRQKHHQWKCQHQNLLAKRLRQRRLRRRQLLTPSRPEVNWCEYADLHELLSTVILSNFHALVDRPIIVSRVSVSFAIATFLPCRWRGWVQSRHHCHTFYAIVEWCQSYISEHSLCCFARLIPLDWICYYCCYYYFYYYYYTVNCFFLIACISYSAQCIGDEPSVKKTFDNNEECARRTWIILQL